MLILTDLLNQRSNQFIQNIHVHAFCNTYDIEFYHLPFVEKYFTIYPNLATFRKSNLERIVHKIKVKLYRTFFKNKIVYLCYDETVQAQSDKIIEGKNKNVYAIGGRFRAEDYVKNQRTYFKTLFEPGFDTSKLSNKYLTRENNTQTIIGVHIRRTDYIFYEKGMYYFEDEIYINMLKQIVNLVNNNYKIIIFTDDKNLNFSAYSTHFNNIQLSLQNIEEDYYLMGKCDYLLSTNSTFTLVAAYLGTCKLYRFMAPNEAIDSLDLFEECEILQHTSKEATRAYNATVLFEKKKSNQLAPN